MKRSKKITIVIVIFFLVIAIVIIGRTMIGNHFKKKFSKRPPPGIIVTTVEERLFENTIFTFGTAIPAQTKSYKIEKYEILKPLNYNVRFNKDDVIAKLKNRTIVAPFSGILGKREFSDDLEVSKASILVNLEDTSTIFIDVDIPEVYASNIKIGLPANIKFSGNTNKNYVGEVHSVAGRINEDTRSLSARIMMSNPNSEILPGSLLEILIKYNARNNLGVPDTSTMIEGDDVFIYTVDQDNKTKKTPIKIGYRSDGFIEIKEGLNQGERIVAEGLKKVRPNLKIKPITK